MQSDGNLFSVNYLKFQPQFKPLNQGLQSATKMWLQSVLGWWIARCGNSGLQSVIGVGLQSVAKWITKCVRDYKVWRGRLQSASGIIKCGGVTKWVSTTLTCQIVGVGGIIFNFFENFTTYFTLLWPLPNKKFLQSY